jgi:hypothetical protein
MPSLRMRSCLTAYEISFVAIICTCDRKRRNESADIDVRRLTLGCQVYIPMDNDIRSNNQSYCKCSLSVIHVVDTNNPLHPFTPIPYVPFIQVITQELWNVLALWISVPISCYCLSTYRPNYCLSTYRPKLILSSQYHF